MRRISRHVHAIIWPGTVFCLCLFGCTKRASRPESDPATADLSPKEQKILDEYRAEVEIGRDMAGRLLAYYGSFGDEQVIGYLNQVGTYVGSYSDYPERRYMFAVLNTEAINAFACPGGYVLVTLGTLRLVDNEAQLASVLGHEIAHVGRQHMFSTLKSMNKEEIDRNAAEGEAMAKKIPALKMRQRPKVEETQAGTVLARYLSGSAGAGINILQAAKAGMNLIMEKGISPKLELEADTEGVKYAIRAGYEPRAMLAFFRKSSKAMPEKVKRLGKTHPSFDARRKNVSAVLAELKASEIIGATGVKRMERIQKRLPPPED